MHLQTGQLGAGNGENPADSGGKESQKEILMKFLYELSCKTVSFLS